MLSRKGSLRLVLETPNPVPLANLERGPPSSETEETSHRRILHLEHAQVVLASDY